MRALLVPPDVHHIRGKIMRVIGRIFAFLFAIAFVLSLPLALTLYNVQAGLISADTYKNAFIDQDVYNQASQIAAGELANFSAQPDYANQQGMELLRMLSPEETAKALAIMLPATLSQPLVENLIDQIFALINTGQGSVTLNATALKQSIRANGVTAMHSLIEGKPACTQQQLQQIARGEINLCQLPPEQAARFDAQVSKTLSAMADQLPDNRVLVSDEQAAKMQQQLSYVPMIRNLAMASLLVPLLALGLIALFAVRSKRSLMRWWGVPLLIGGLIAIIANRSANFLGLDALRAEIANNGLTEAGTAYLTELGGAVAGAVLTPMMIESVIAIIIGLAMIIYARRLPKPDAASPATVEA